LARIVIVWLYALAAACAAGDRDEAAGGARAIAFEPAATMASSTRSPDTPVPNRAPIAIQAPSKPTSNCPVVTSRGWTAAVIGKPPDAGDRLRVSGTLTLTEAGWRASLTQGPVLEIHPPIQRLELKFERAGDGPREIAVRGEFSALAEYGAIDIRCGNRPLASITSVAWTENKIMDEE
jgi:hypothetical protein